MENPVTAVLLNFRSYDTLLEIVVLLLAALCVGTFSDAEREPAALSAGPVLLAFVRSVIPVMVTVAAYLLWAGASRPGGAFQAGAVLAGAGVLLLLADGAAHPVMKVWLSPPPLAIGVLAFILAAVSGAAAGGRLLEYPRELAGVLIVIVEAAAALSIGAILTVLFARTTVLRREQPPQFEEIAGDRAEE